MSNIIKCLISQLDNEERIVTPISLEGKKFESNTLLMLSGTTGFTSQQQRLCHSYIYVPVINAHFDKLLKYESKLSICLSQFMSQHSDVFEEKKYTGEKFDINLPDDGRRRRMVESSGQNDRTPGVNDARGDLVDPEEDVNYFSIFDVDS